MNYRRPHAPKATEEELAKAAKLVLASQPTPSTATPTTSVPPSPASRTAMSPKEAPEAGSHWRKTWVSIVRFSGAFLWMVVIQCFGIKMYLQLFIYLLRKPCMKGGPGYTKHRSCNRGSGAPYRTCKAAC